MTTNRHCSECFITIDQWTSCGICISRDRHHI